MLRNNALRPIKIFGSVLLAVGIIGIFFDFIYLNDPQLSKGFKIFGIIVSMWHILAGMGVIFQRAWGFYIFKSYLYVLFLGFPIGTYIASKMLNQIKSNELKKYFG